MHCRVASSMELVVVVFLDSVIRQWLAWYLPARDASPVREHRKHQRIDRALLLQDIQHLATTLADKRTRPIWIGYELLAPRSASLFCLNNAGRTGRPYICNEALAR